MATTGHIYIAMNASMPGMLKVGKTCKPPEQRTAELSAPTGVPCDFLVAFDVLVTDIDEAEKRVHARLAARRVNKNREFFRVPLKEAIATLQTVQAEFHVPQAPTAKETSNATDQGEAVACTTPSSCIYASTIPSSSWVNLPFWVKGLSQHGARIPFSSWDSALQAAPRPPESRFGTSEWHQALLAADAALESGDVEAMVAASKRFGGSGEVARKLLFEAAKRGRIEVCGDLAKLWPEHGVFWIQKLSLFWIAASAGDLTVRNELSSYWHLVPAESKEQMRQLARKLNSKFECKDF